MYIPKQHKCNWETETKYMIDKANSTVSLSAPFLDIIYHLIKYSTGLFNNYILSLTPVWLRHFAINEAQWSQPHQRLQSRQNSSWLLTLILLWETISTQTTPAKRTSSIKPKYYNFKKDADLGTLFIQYFHISSLLHKSAKIYVKRKNAQHSQIPELINIHTGLQNCHSISLIAAYPDYPDKHIPKEINCIGLIQESTQNAMLNGNINHIKRNSTV